jgi:hypothetical protein
MEMFSSLSLIDLWNRIELSMDSEMFRLPSETDIQGGIMLMLYLASANNIILR